MLIGPANPAQSLPQRRGDPRRRQVDRRAGDPPRLRLPVGERRLRPYRRGERPDLGRARRGRDHRDGRQDQRPEPDGGGRGAGRARHHRPGRRPSTRRSPRRREIGYPVMVKAAAGGGGMGMARRRPTRPRCAPSTTRCARFAERMFGDGSVLIERYFPRVRHVEVQILGLADGRVVALGERECSVQRRNQKLVEESPSPAVSRRSCARACWPPPCAPARRSATATRARSSACSTRPPGEFFFLEMNTRLQVEHPVTEAVYGVDLVEEQLRVAVRPGADLRPGRARPARPRHRAADQRRGPEALPARPRRDHDLGRADRRGRPGRLRLRRGHHGHARSTTR